MIILKLSENQARMVYELVTRDGSYDYLGKNTELEIEKYWGLATVIGCQIEEQGIYLGGINSDSEDFEDEADDD
jgi:hypothetical protein